MGIVQRVRLSCRSGSQGSVHPFRRLVIVCLLAVLAFSLASETGLSSVSPELIREAARRHLRTSVNDALHARLLQGESSFVEVLRDETGQICSVSADTEALNALRGELLSDISGRLQKKTSVWIPVGSLTGIGLLNGRGFSVPVRLQFESSADVRFETEFLSAGVNQSCYRLTLVVHAAVFSQSRRFETREETESATMLSETVIVGEVPWTTPGSWGP